MSSGFNSVQFTSQEVLLNQTFRQSVAVFFRGNLKFLWLHNHHSLHIIIRCNGLLPTAESMPEESPLGPSFIQQCLSIEVKESIQRNDLD